MHIADGHVVLGSQHGLDPRGADRLIDCSQQDKQRRIDSDLAVLRGQFQYLQIFLAALMQAKLLLKQVEGHAEAAGREQLIAVPVVFEGARLAHQPVDDLPVIYAMLLPPAQAWHLGCLLLPVPDLHMVHKTAALPPARRSTGSGLSTRCGPRRLGCLSPPSPARAWLIPCAIPAT